MEKLFNGDVVETDNDFFDEMYEMEKELLTEMGENDALEYIEKEKKLNEED